MSFRIKSKSGATEIKVLENPENIYIAIVSGICTLDRCVSELYKYDKINNKYWKKQRRTNKWLWLGLLATGLYALAQKKRLDDLSEKLQSESEVSCESMDISEEGTEE